MNNFKVEAPPGYVPNLCLLEDIRPGCYVLYEGEIYTAECSFGPPEFIRNCNTGEIHPIGFVKAKEVAQLTPMTGIFEYTY